MWKKTDESSEPSVDRPVTVTPQTEQLRDRAIIGSSIFVKGELRGNENLLIQGRVDGTVDLKENNVTVGESGKVKADINAKTISIEGDVRGNLLGSDKVIIRKSGSVHGNIQAPRVSLEEGSKFKGSIDMEPKDGAKPLLAKKEEAKSESAPGQVASPKKANGSGLSTRP